MKYKKLQLSLGILIFGFMAQAQQRTTVTGGDASGGGGSASYSIGLVDYQASTGTGGSSAQGVQHAYEIFTLGIETHVASNISISVFPNPSTDTVNLKIDDISGGQLCYQLFDLSGHLLKQNTINDTQTQMSMANCPSATYILHITQEDKKIKSFKILKN